MLGLNFFKCLIFFVLTSAFQEYFEFLINFNFLEGFMFFMMVIILVELIRVNFHDLIIDVMDVS